MMRMDLDPGPRQSVDNLVSAVQARDRAAPERVDAWADVVAAAATDVVWHSTHSEPEPVIEALADAAYRAGFAAGLRVRDA